MDHMEKQLFQIKKRMETEAAVYNEIKSKLQTNPIKAQFNNFINQKLKISVIDLLKNK